MLDSKFETLRNHFGIFQPVDWCSVRPEWITRIDGVGPVTLDHLRIYLAMQNLILLDDRTPEHWKQTLGAVKIGQTLGDPEEPGADVGVMNPFTILIDSAEQNPFTFLHFHADADRKNRPLIVPTDWRPLGRHPESLGDYSIEGFIGRCHVERKSMEDAHGTILGWDGRRERFERELENLSRLDAALVVVECSLETLCRQAPTHKQTAQQNSKTLHRSIIAFQQDYSVRWLFCDTRRLAEQTTFRFFERYWHRQHEAEKQTAKELAAVSAEDLLAAL